jgi:hypothetical protein
VTASMIRMSRSWTSMRTGSGVGPADADVIEAAGVAEGDFAVGVDAVGADAVGADAVVGGGGAVAGDSFGPGGVGGGWCLAVRQGAACRACLRSSRIRSEAAPGLFDCVVLLAGRDVYR